MRPLITILALFTAGIVGHAAIVGPRPSEHPPREQSQSRVPVIITSDGDTFVSITNLLPPAKFVSKKINLSPGTYEVIGRRKGYRDVSEILQVQPSTNPVGLQVVCTESVQ